MAAAPQRTRQEYINLAEDVIGVLQNPANKIPPHIRGGLVSEASLYLNMAQLAPDVAPADAPSGLEHSLFDVSEGNVPRDAPLPTPGATQ